MSVWMECECVGCECVDGCVLGHNILHGHG